MSSFLMMENGKLNKDLYNNLNNEELQFTPIILHPDSLQGLYIEIFSGNLHIIEGNRLFGI